jgi:MFS family permease
VTTQPPSAAPTPDAGPTSATRPALATTRWGRFRQGWRQGLAHHHDFRQLWVGDTISQLGTQLSVLALPVLAIRLLDADELQMGLLATFETLAFLVVGLPAGAWVDRWRKKRVLVAGDVLRAVALASLPLAWAFDALTLPQLYAVALATGVCTVFFDVAYQSYLPEIVPSNRISEGNSKLQVSQSVAMVAGPAAGGFLIRVIGAPLTIAVDALSFLGSAFFVRRIEHPDHPPSREGRRPLTVEIREGLSFVLRHPLLLRITACTATGNLFGAMSAALLMLFALRDLGLTEATMGLVFAVGAIGGLLGAVLVGAITRLVGEGRAIPLSALAFAPGASLVPLAGPLPAVPALVASMFLFSFAVVVYNVTQVSFRQRVCPRPLLGRMNASIRFIVWGCQPIGAAAGGVLGQTLGIRATLWIAAAGALLSALPVLLSPLIGMRDLPRELDQHA